MKIASKNVEGALLEVYEETVDFASIAAGAVGSVALTIAGAKTGDKVKAHLADTPTVAIAPAGGKVTDADEVTVYAVNPSAGALDEDPLKWIIELYKVS